MKRRSLIQGSGLFLLAANPTLIWGLTKQDRDDVRITLQQANTSNGLYLRLDKFFFSENTFQARPPKNEGRLPLLVRAAVRTQEGVLPVGAKIALCQPDTFRNDQRLAKGTKHYTSWTTVENSSPLLFRTHVPVPNLKRHQDVVSALDFIVIFEGKWGVSRVYLDPLVIDSIKNYDLGQRSGGVATTSLTDVALTASGVQKNHTFPIVTPKLADKGLEARIKIVIN